VLSDATATINRVNGSEEENVKQETLNGYISASDVAEELGVSRVRVTHLTQQGRLPFLQTRIGRLYPQKEIAALAAQRAEEAKKT
jgi:biotin operon repressor